MPESDQAQAKTVILRVNKPARMGIDDASLYPLQPCLPRGLRAALLRKASVLRNWLLRKWDARQPRSAFSRSVLLHCCVLRMCAETNFSHPIPDSSRCGDNQVHAPMLQPIGASVGSERKRGPQRPLN